MGEALPPHLSGPVEVALARAQDTIPEPGELPGGCVYELVPPGTVLDGEVVVWNGERLDFDLLSRRLVTGPAQIGAVARAWPASFVAFYLLARGADLRALPWTNRRAALEDLAASWRPPLQLTPVTTDVGLARAWLADYRPAGVEGLVVKAAAGRYVTGRRAPWIKVKSRQTHELVVGGVLGPIRRPGVVVLGRYRGARLVMLARTVPLSEHQARELAAVLRPAAGEHPWPELISGGRFGIPGEKIALTRVEPLVVVEVSADAALHAGSFRHPVRYLRHRPDLEPADVPPLGI